MKSEMGVWELTAKGHEDTFWVGEVFYMLLEVVVI